MTHRFLRLSLLAAAVTLLTSRAFSLDYFVSPSGNDANAGTLAAPFKTIVKAIAASRSAKVAGVMPAGGITIYLRAGEYYQTESIVLDARDAGTASAPLTFAPYNSEFVTLTGGVTLDSSKFIQLPATDPSYSKINAAVRSKIVTFDLSAAGLANTGSLKPRALAGYNLAPMELFAQGIPADLAQWPNATESMARTMAPVTSNSFTYNDPRVSSWQNEVDPWVHGAWGFGWADYHYGIAAINSSTNTITLEGTPNGMASGSSYIAYNMLCELDAKSEYYIDRVSSKLYYYPPFPVSYLKLQVSMLETPIVDIRATSHIKFKQISFECARGELVYVKEASNITFDQCLFRNAGLDAINLNATESGITDSEITNSGNNGIRIRGGNRASLTASNNHVLNSRIHRTGRYSYGTSAGVVVEDGCGAIVRGNLIDDLPGAGVIYSGNNHIFEANEIRNVCLSSGDFGAVYSGRDLGYRGIVINNNFIHHVRSKTSTAGTSGIYMDAIVSSIKATNNILYKIESSGFLLGGGRDHKLTNNIIADTGIALYCGDYARRYVNNTPGSSFNLLERLAASGIKYQSPPWSTAYPECAAIPNNYDQLMQGLWLSPQGCVFSNNAGWGNEVWEKERITSNLPVFGAFESMTGNIPSNPELFTEEQSLDRSQRALVLTPSAPLSSISFSSIGRTTAAWPARRRAPAVTEEYAKAVSDTEVYLKWIDWANMPANQETGLTIERRTLPNGDWTVIKNLGPDTDSYIIRDLAQDSDYSFRVKAVNATGSSTTGIQNVSTLPAPLVSGTPVRFEAESAFSPSADVGTISPVIVKPATLASGGKCVIIYDKGDTARISYSVPTSGTYRISVRLRAGNGVQSQVYFSGGYKFSVDGSPLELIGNPTSLSALDTTLMQTYWGTMDSGYVSMSAGSHYLDTVSIFGWLAVDSIDVTPLAPPKAKSYSEWLNLNFSKDQISNSSLAGLLSMPGKDSIPNIAKYALGLRPWYTETAAYAANLKSSNTGGIKSLTYTRPKSVTDVKYQIESSGDGKTWFVQTSNLVGTGTDTQTYSGGSSLSGSLPTTSIRLRLTIGTTTWTTANF